MPVYGQSWKIRLVSFLIGISAVVGLFQTLGTEVVFYIGLLGLSRFLWNAKVTVHPKRGVNEAPSQERPELPQSAMRPSKRGDD